MGSARSLITTSMYLIGCVLLVPGSIDLIDSEFYRGIVFYIVGCALLMVAAVIDLFANLISKPIIKDYSDELISASEKKMSDWKKQRMIALSYLLGGVFFFVGSILYWPDFSAECAPIGTWVFRTGSICYLIGSFVSIHSIYTSEKESQNKNYSTASYMWIAVLICYIIGSLCFITGGIISQAGGNGSNQIWLCGSISFTIGALLSVIETIRSWK
jgi:hypothetical protein